VALGAMDPLQRLAENNRKGAAVNKKEGNYRHFFFSVSFILLYAGAIYFYFSYEKSILGFDFWGPTKQIWLIAVSFTGGIGSLFFSGGVAIVIWSDIFAKELETKVKSINTLVFSALLIGVSSLFIFLAIILSIFVVDNNKEIFNFLCFGYSEPPYFIEMILNFVVLIIVSVSISIFHSIFTLPFKAKRHAKEFAPNKPLKQDK